MGPYDLTPAAAADLRSIARHTLRQWGARQQRRYAGQLEACCHAIGDRTAVSRSFSDRNPHVQVVHCRHHYIFYLRPSGRTPLVIAVLHERMDLPARLKGRLDPRTPPAD